MMNRTQSLKNFVYFVGLNTTDQIYIEGSEMLCWRMMEKVNWTDRVIDKQGLQLSILHTIKRMYVNWIGQILHKKCLIKYVDEGR